MLEFYLVDVKNISSNTPRSQFPEAELEQLADLILKAEGLLMPLPLRQTGPESYEVIEGHREYYAAVKAKEKNPRKGEMVNAFIVSGDLETHVQNQAQAIIGPKPEDHTSSLAQRVTNLDTRLDQAIQDLKLSQRNEIHRLESDLKDLRERLPKPLEPLSAFNTLGEHDLIKVFNRAGVRGKTAEKIIKTILVERNKKLFESFNDILARKLGLGAVRLIAILDNISDR